MLKSKVRKLKTSGQALVEMALVLPILIALIFGMMDFGRVLNGYLVATEASREGARVATLRKDDTEIRTAVINASPTLDQTKMTITISPAGTRTRGDSVTVAITYNVDIITPLINTMLTNPYPVQCQTVMRVE